MRGTIPKLVANLQAKVNPLQKTGLLSRLLFFWIGPLIAITRRTIFLQSMHPNLCERDRIHWYWRQLRVQYKKSKDIGSCLKSAFLIPFLLTLLLSLVDSLLYGASLIVVYLITQKIEVEVKDHGRIEDSQSILYLFGSLAATYLVRGFIKEQANFERLRIGMRMKGSMSLLLFDKLMKIGIVNPSKNDEGSLTSHLQLDCSRFEDSMMMISMMIISTCNVIIAVIVGVYLLDSVFFILVAMLLVGLSPVMFSSQIIARLERYWSARKDVRINFWKTLYSNIKYFKIRAFENEVYNKLVIKRTSELKYQWKLGLVYVSNSFLGNAGPALSLTMFVMMYIYLGFSFQLPQVTILLRLYLIIHETLYTIPDSVRAYVSLKIAVNRLNDFFKSPELQISKIRTIVDDPSDPVGLQVENGNYFWRYSDNIERNKLTIKTQVQADVLDSPKVEKIRKLSKDQKEPLKEPLVKAGPKNLNNKLEKGFQLRNVNFRALKNQLTFVIGEIGSGKSSLLMAFVGEMEIENLQQTKMKLCGNMSFISQKPWIMNSTIKENVLMGKPFDQELFEYALKYSCLSDDIKTFPKGIENETGEGGEVLSGGQKTRLSLAQALYQDTEIYLFDDILSALDSYVGSFIMEETIKKKLKHKTVIMATHALQYLKYADYSFLMDDGRITHEGGLDVMSKTELYRVYTKMNDILKSSTKTSISETRFEKVDMISQEQDLKPAG
jgi:ATP-binding cassette subfamily C (CFTR/MRP) protein 1